MRDLAPAILEEVTRGMAEMGVKVEVAFQIVLAERITRRVKKELGLS